LLDNQRHKLPFLFPSLNPFLRNGDLCILTAYSEDAIGNAFHPMAIAQIVGRGVKSMFRFRTIRVLLVFAVLVGTLNAVLAQDTVLEANKELLTCWVEDIMNGRDVGMADAVFAADMTVFHPPLGTFDTNSYKGLVDALHVSFPDLNVSDYTVVVGDNNVAAQFVMQGTFAEDLLGVPATGESIVTSGVLFAEVADGRIAHMDLFYDWQGLQQQMGAIPVAQITGERPQLLPGGIHYPD
jgi:steroid delta-isomerase-like uncharacterized protein